jgi:hypothetical protein
MMRRRFLQLLAACGAFLAGLFRGLPALAYDGTIEGDFAGTVPNGQHWHITGNVNLTGDLIVEGLLTGVDTFTLTGNGFQVLVQNGGVVDLAGQAKSGWVCWGDTVTGWNVGDRLAVAPTLVGVFVPTVVTWQGSWAATLRPANAADVTLVDGSTARPEVANLTRTITMTGLRRFHLHNGAGVQSLKHFALVNCGTVGVLGDYPLHFHLNGETSRGSTVTGVVVEGGKNHAFVPHGSHGITFTDTVAYNTENLAYWWDPPLSNNNTFDPNDSDDITFDHCLAILVPGTMSRLDGFHLGRGVGNICTGSAATCVQGGNEASGFQWPEVGIGLWTFTNCVSHNNKTFGIFTWQNSNLLHVIAAFKAYRNGVGGIKHGAYGNFYHYLDIVLSDQPTALLAHAVTRSHVDFPNERLIFENVLTNGPLVVSKHNTSGILPTFYRNCTFTGVTYQEVNANKSSYNVFEDCGLVPADFTFTIIQPQSVIEILEGGVLQYRWAAGTWS